MTGKPGASGGAREGAGRPHETYKGNLYTGETPTEKLWRWLEEKCGSEIAKEAHLYFNSEKREYEKRKANERKDIMATLEEAIQAKKEDKIVLANWAGRRVTIVDFVQDSQTERWSAGWNDPDGRGLRWDDVDESDTFIIRGKFAPHR